MPRLSVNDSQGIVVPQLFARLRFAVRHLSRQLPGVGILPVCRLSWRARVTDRAIDRVLAKLKGVREVNGRWMAVCPTHDDRQASLSLKIGNDGRAVMFCQAGCETASVLGSIGLTMTDLFSLPLAPGAPRAAVTGPAQGVAARQKMVKSYDYLDADGDLLFQACRFEPKTFRQRHKGPGGEWVWNLDGVTPVLYRLPELIEALAKEQRVYIVEGEKDADALSENGYTATTTPMGAGKWKESYAQLFAGADVAILPDNDDPGRAHAEQIAASLFAVQAKVRIVTLPNLPVKGDASDWLDATKDIDQLGPIVDATALWAPTGLASRRTRWRLDEVWQNEAMMRPPAPVVPYLAWASRSTLLAAREKSGKSTLTGFISAAVSNGGDFLGEPCSDGKVLVIGLEEFIGDTARRLREFGADGKRIELVDHFASDPADRPSEVRAHIEAVCPALVILDSLMAYAQGTVTDSNNATQTQAVVQSLTDIAHSTAVALVIIHHARKADGKYRDSSAIGGAVDIIAEVFPPEGLENTDPTRRRVRPIGRVPARSVDFRFDGTTYSLVDTEGDTKATLDQRILAVVTDRPGMSANDVVGATGESRGAVLRRVQLMVQNGLLLNDGTSQFMKLRTPIYPPASGLFR